MALSIDPLTYVITVPKADLTLVQSSPTEIRELSIDAFRLELKAYEADQDNGIYLLKTHSHNTEVQLGGIVYARIVEILAPYTITFEDGQYAVNLVGANSNIGDVVNVNQVSVRSQNSAGLISNQAIEFSSFNGGVTIDFSNITGQASSGTVFPTGTRQVPVDNLADAALIAARRGLSKIYVIGNLTVDNTASWERFEFVGESALKSTVTVLDAAQVLNCEFYDCTVTGVLDGNSQIERAVVNAIDFVDGYIFQCSLGPSTITLGTSTTANMFSCYSTVPGAITPEINMNGTGILALRDYNGGMTLKNYTGTGAHSIDLASGQIKLDPTTITSGTFVLRGVGKVTDESTGLHIPSGVWNGGVTIINELVNTMNTVDGVWDEATADHTTAGTTGKALIDAGAAGNPWDSPLAGSNTPGTFGELLQTTFVGYFNNIINAIATTTTNTIKKITGSQPNQK